MPLADSGRQLDQGADVMAKILIVYFSVKGQTLGPGMKIIDREKGNTAIAAEFIHQAVGGDMFEIKAAKEYPRDHMLLIEEAKRELDSGTRVPLKEYPEEGIEEYDTIFLGYPNWRNTMPMVMFTFLEHYDWTGKRIITFCTNEGSGLGSSVDDIRRSAKGADVTYGISIRGSQVKNMEERISAWAKSAISITGGN